MRECATILAEFNDKKETFEAFLALYLQNVDLETYPASDLKQVERSMVQLRKDLSRVIETALKSIIRVFPEPESVIKNLIHKVFGDLLLRFLRKATQPILGGNAAESKQDTMDVMNDLLSSAGGGIGTHRVQLSQGMNGQYGGSSAMHVPMPGTHTMSHSQSDVSMVSEGDHDALVNRLSKKELEEYLKMTHIVYLQSHGLVEELKGFVREIVFEIGKGDDVERQEKEYSVRHIVEEDKLMSLVFEGHQQRYLKLEKKHLRNKLREVMREHVIEPLQLGGDLALEPLSDMEASPSLNTPSNVVTPSHMMVDNMGGTVPSSNMMDIQITNLSASASLEKETPKSTGGRKPKFGKFGKFNAKGQTLTKQLMQSAQSYTQRQVRSVARMMPKNAKEREEMMGRLRQIFQFGINECVATMKKQVSVSLTRCKNISAAEELSRNIHELFLVYLKAIESLFRERLIPICRATLPKARGEKHIEHWYFLEAVHHTNSALQLVEQCFINDVSPAITENFEFQICKQDKDRVYRGFEEDILSGLRQLLEVGLGVLRTILEREQQKSDFKPKGDDITNLSATRAATMACAFIDQFKSRTLICLDGRNLDRFFLCLGTRLYYIVIDHFKEYQYNPTGAQILALDAKLYQSTAKQFRIERINELFLTLVERTMLISIPADSIKPYIEGDAKLSKIDKKELQKWLRLRYDYKTAKIEQKLFE